MTPISSETRNLDLVTAEDGLGYVDDALAIGLVLTQLDRFVTPSMRVRVQELMPEGMKSKSTKERRTKKDEKVEDK